MTTQQKKEKAEIYKIKKALDQYQREIIEKENAKIELKLEGTSIEDLRRHKDRIKALDESISEANEMLEILREKLSTMNVEVHSAINLTPDYFGLHLADKIADGGGFSYNGDVESVKTQEEAIKFYTSLFDLSNEDPVRFGFIDESSFPEDLKYFPAERHVFDLWQHSTLIHWPPLTTAAITRLKRTYKGSERLRSATDKWRYMEAFGQEIDLMYQRQKSKTNSAE